MSTSIITLQPAGWSFPADADTPILRAAEQAGIELPSSCRNGTCRTCICRVAGTADGGAGSAGRVRHLVEWPGLSPEEKRDGYILPCVAVALEDVTIEQRLARRVTTSG